MQIRPGREVNTMHLEDLAEDGLRKDARKYARTGVFPQYLNSVDMREAQAFWRLVREYDRG